MRCADPALIAAHAFIRAEAHDHRRVTLQLHDVTERHYLIENTPCVAGLTVVGAACPHLVIE
jgi:hypothetical protein